MKRTIHALLCCSIFLLFLSLPGQAQIINTIAGTTIAGYSGDGGPSYAAQLYHPKGAAIDGMGNLYIADADNNVVRKINTSGTISTFAGNTSPGFGGDGGAATAAELNAPDGVAVDSDNNIYICDADNYCVRKVNMSGIISTVAGTGGVSGYTGDGSAATTATLSFPAAIALDLNGNMFIADEYNNCIRKVNNAGVISTYAGAGSTGYTGDGGLATAANIGFPFGVACDGYGNVYVSLTYEDRIVKITTAGIITSIAGTGPAGGFGGDGGPATAADFDNPWGIASDWAGNIYVADNANERIRKINTAGIASTVAGNGTRAFFGDGGPAILAELKDPAGVAVLPNDALLIADYNNHAMRAVAGSWTHTPTFTGGHSQSLSICENATATSINSLLAISDLDTGQFELWKVVSLPAHGTLYSPYNAISTGGTITPTGLTYTPATGYTGTDAFKVRITDFSGADTTTINVTVNACPTGVNSVSSSNANYLEVFPNPNTGSFTIHLSSGIASELAHIIITNVLGEKVKEVSVTTNTFIPVELQPVPGLYHIGAVTSHDKWNAQILVQ